LKSIFPGGKGYLDDVTRRKNNAPIGTMEKITIEAFIKMKAEGVEWGTLGLTPLVNAAEDRGIAGKLLE
jgi:phosphatidylglycerol lysyltransferase